MVLEQFFDFNKRNVVLSADTGTGKSIIAAVIAKCFNYIEPEKLAAFTLMQNNALVGQYADTFGKYSEKEFYQIKGASNYPCPALQELTNDPNVNAESCVFEQLPEPAKLKFCTKCSFRKSRSLRNETMNLITNYSYYFVSKMWSESLEDRPLTVFDEAHTINEVFCDHNAIFFSVERLDDYANEVTRDLGPHAEAEAKTFREIKSMIKSGQVRESNYMDVCRKLLHAYKTLTEKYMEHAEGKSMENAVKIKSIGKKYFNLGCKIGDLIQYNYDHVFEYRGDDEQSVSIKPVFIGRMAETILGKRNLFMSATISDKYIIETLELDHKTVGFVKLPPVFPAEAKAIVFVGNRSLNYGLMNDSDVIADLANQCNMIVDAHAGQEEKGLILVPSFKVAEQMAQGIKSRRARVFLHDRRTPLHNLLYDFKKCTKPAVLISPSIYEGLDFAGDDSRYQIILKAPYPSLGEKRMKHIADKYGDIYRLMTLKKVIQGIGRSVRSEDDWAVTYVLDANVKKLFNSDLNVWEDQFEVSNA